MDTASRHNKERLTSGEGLEKPVGPETFLEKSVYGDPNSNPSLQVKIAIKTFFGNDAIVMGATQGETNSDLLDYVTLRIQKKRNDFASFN